MQSLFSFKMVGILAPQGFDFALGSLGRRNAFKKSSIKVLIWGNNEEGEKSGKGNRSLKVTSQK